MSDIPEKNNTSQKVIIGLLTFSIVANVILMFMLFDEKSKTNQLTGQNTEITEEKENLTVELNDMLAQLLDSE